MKTARVWTHWILMSCVLYYGPLGCCQSLAWIDPPTSQSLLHDISDGNKFLNIASLLDAYHTIKKSDPKQLPNRIDKLRQLEAAAKQLTTKDNHFSNYTVLIFTQLAKQCANKARYLDRISRINLAGPEDFHHYDYLFSSRYFPRENDSLQLLNTVFFSPHQQSDLGLFWLEVIDPCHRDLQPYWSKWMKLKPPRTNFFLWLEEQVIPRGIHQIKIFNQDELSEAKVFPINGQLYQKSSKHKNHHLINQTEYPIEYIFNFSTQHILRIARASQLGIRHVSLSGGAPILSAGALWFSRGKINKIFFRSGHYRPKLKHYKIMMDYFINNKIDLSAVAQVQFYEGANISSLSLNDFLDYIQSAS